MMDDAPLTETQRALMPDLGDDACGFWDLVWLGTGEQHAQESSDALLDLYRRGYVEIYEHEPGPGLEPRSVVSPEIAEDAIRDLSNWASPPDETKARWYTAYLTDSGFAKWRDDHARFTSP